MTIPTSSIEQVIPGQGSMAQPESAKPVKTRRERFRFVRNRVGIQYEDDCLEVGVTWRRDYERIGTFRKGSTFAIHLALKGISR